MALACERAGRVPDAVTLIAVTKTQPPDAVVQAYQAGVRHFGENYVQEALGKRQNPDLDWPDATWHFTGHLQSNKAREVVGRFDVIESIDSAGLAREVARRAQAKGQTARILLEVKLDPIPAKFGFPPERVLEEAAAILQMPGLGSAWIDEHGPLRPERGGGSPVFSAVTRPVRAVAAGVSADAFYGDDGRL